jgi:GDPmannose 4,6-dehydratase
MHSKRDWGWAPEYVEALISISRLENASTFILSTGQINTVADLVMHAFHSQGITAYEKFLKTDETRMRIVDAQALVGEASKAKAYFGWQSKTSVGEIMGKMVSWDLKVLDDPSVEFSLEWNH